MIILMYGCLQQLKTGKNPTKERRDVNEAMGFYSIISNGFHNGCLR